MTIEVRQLLIRSQVDTAPAQPAPGSLSEQDRDQVKEEILAECRRWLAQQLQNHHER